MKKITTLKIIPFLLLILWGCTKLECPPESIPLTQTITDTIVLQGVQLIHSEVHSISPNTNYSSSARMAVWCITDNNITDTARTFLKFDYSSIPSGVTITSALLTLYADSNQVEVGLPGYTVISGPNNWLIESVSSSWETSTITWDNAPSPVDTILVSPIHVPASASQFQTYTIDLTTLVKREISNPSNSYGIVMRLANESKWRGLAFYSPTLQTGGLHTNLTIQYQK